MLSHVDTPLGRALADQDLSQVWLARRLSERLGRQIGRNRVWEWVHGIHPEKETREAIADLLGRTPAELWPQREIAESAA